MIYLLVIENQIKMWSCSKHAEFPEIYTEVEIETQTEEGEALNNIPDGFKEDYSLFEYDGEKIIKK